MAIAYPHNTNKSTAVIELSEQVIGGADAMDFSAKISELVTGGTNKVILDLNKVEIINSSGFGMIVAAHTTMRKNAGTLILANVPVRVNKLLDMTRLSSIFTIVPSLKEAMERE